MKLGRRTSLAAALVGIALLLVTATVGAATVKGTAGNDTLRGTAAADKLSGLGGNDKLYGLGGNDVLVGAAGNDLLVGGPGADTLQCGAGKDVARGDAQDKVANDCEVVTGVPKPEPPAPPAPPPPPPPPPAPKPLAGLYCGNTVQGPPLCVRTSSDATAVVEVETSSLVDCTQPVQFRFEFTIGFNGTLTIRPDLTFDLNYTGPVSTGSSAITNMRTTYFIRGTFTTEGKASGQLAVTSLEFDYSGYHFACTQNPVDWSATKQG